ncbi:ABC transporter ATP-binding protein [Acuticoccus yangtzensis]|uniref:ABC transporter ATP-binding protein n=1 Tax=Acuticoccus yangtzensis TaxID=1443441 RepID=UPI00094991C3|nr:ABC transporter ATP-binding protein [Acuticoccus yangtzensis]ORE95663.1 lipoprotein releasing system ATP-binding protein [Stappia sp. 22II-S9-Z10]
MAPPLVLSGIVRTFSDGSDEVRVLTGADFTLNTGELVALAAPSGSGKSTLLQIAGLLERATSGTVTIDGVEASSLSDKDRTAIRRDKVGFIYQFHHLLGDFTARENVALPQRLAGLAPKAALERADDLLARLGLADRRTHRPGQLSGGERQRVAIARAVANHPKLILADEPTGNLDQATAETVRDAFLSLSRDTGLSALVATHNPTLASQLDRTVTLKEGKIAPLELTLSGE